MKYLWTQKKQFLCASDQQGYIALVSVLIISALVVLVATSASLASISEADMGLQESQAWQSFYLTTACAEHGLMKLKDDIEYSGNETLNFTNGSCTILPIEGTGDQDRTIKVTGNVSNQTSKIKVEINEVNPDMEISSWQQVADF